MAQYFDNEQPLKQQKEKIIINFQNKQYPFLTTSGTFSKNNFDYGSRLLLETLIKETTPSENLLDLGCGYGVIGLLTADLYPKLNIDMVDITDRAINLSKENAHNLNINNVNIFKSNIYSNIKSKYKYIVTNPPIKAGKKIIREFLFNGKNYLTSDGELWFVMRKNHGVKSIIKELSNIYNTKIITKSKGFYIIKCTLK